MPRFEITGKGKESGRKQKRIYSAADENEARCLADNDGTLVEVITEFQPEPPTERQLKYAKDLEISIPLDATKADLSDLISLKVEKDTPSSSRHRDFANRYRVETTQYIGKKALFDQIQSALVAPGREMELLSWFVYRVYRELSGGVNDGPIQNPENPVVQGIAARLAKDEKIIKSVRRYDGQELIWFGEWTSPDGVVHSGGSNRTAAYKEASSLLKEQWGIIKNSKTTARPSPAPSKPNRTSTVEQKGCLSVVVLTLIIPVGVLAYVAWFREVFT